MPHFIPEEDFKHIDLKREEVTRWTILSSVLFSVLFSVSFFIADIYPLNIVFTIFAVIHLVVLFIHRKFISTARLLLYFTLMAQVFCMSLLLGKDINTKVFYIPLAIVPFIIFSKIERNYFIASLACTCVNILAIYTIDLPDTFYNPGIPKDSLQLINDAFNLVAISCMMFLSWLFLSLSELGETLMYEKKSELETQKISLAAKNQELEEHKNQQTKLNKLKDKLLTILSHDLKSPINNIQSLAELIIAGKLSGEEVYEMAEKVKESATQTRQLLENLLHWSANQLTENTPRATQIELKPLVGNIFSQTGFKARTKDICLVNQITENEFVWADIYMLEIILRNVIINAIKFSHKGQEVIVRNKTLDNTIKIEIEDKGIGIPDDIMMRLFEPDISKSRLGTCNEKGTGIGLLLCKQLCEANNGSIFAENNPFGGATITIILPGIEKKLT